jgi:hypothetical protein|tara:strand:+ start:2591 stop:3274 length:684 start_codon:yes stop_codon:yes gene_type:complete
MQMTLYKCEYCNSDFKRESTLAVHMCRQKQRHMQEGDHDVQLAFRTYQLFYKVSTNSKKDKSYGDFAKSPYYAAFIKFANYCIDVKIDSIENYTMWLIRNGVKLDNWASDQQFNTWIKRRFKEESVDRAVERSVLFMQRWAEEEKCAWADYFKNIHPNVAVLHICAGRISPWILYGSDTAQELLGRLNDEQIKMVVEYIEPDFWQIRMKRKPTDYDWVKEIMEKAGL